MVGRRTSAQSLLGRASEMTKAAAQARVADIVRPLNNREVQSNPDMRLEDFIQDVYFVVNRRRWKRSTAMTVEHRVKFHISGDLGDKKIGRITREELQSFLERKAN